MTDLLRKYLLSSAVLRSPDDPTGGDPGEVEAGDDAGGEGGDAPAEPAGDVAEPDPAAAATDPVAPAAPAAPAKPHGNTGKKPWYLDRISEANHAKNQEAQRAADATRRAEAAEALLARMQRGETPATTEPPAQRQPGQTQEDFQRAVKDEAARQRIYDETIAVRDAGLEKFPDFNESLNILTAIGATRDDVVSDLIAVDKNNAHAILDKLAKDPDRAAALVAMSPAKRIAEFTRMSMAETAAVTPAPKPAARPATPSAAPKPRPVLAPVSEAPEGEDFSDEKSDAEWGAAWDRKFLKQA